MSELGISVYPDLRPAEEIRNYLEKAASFGCTRVFSSMFSVEGTNDQIIAYFKDMIHAAHAFGLSVSLDVNPQFLKKLGVTPDNLSLFHEIGCDIVQTVPYKKEILVCDEEARLKPWDAGFQLDEWRIVSNALIVAEDEDGEFTDTKLNATDIAQQIRFFGAEEPMPEPCFRVIVL